MCLPDAAELAAKLLDVLRVQVDRRLVGLEPLQYASVVALVAVANALLLGQLLPRVGKELLFVLEFRLENLSAILVAVHRGRRLPARSGYLSRYNGDFLAYQGAVLSYGVALDVRIGRTAARVGTLVDLALS